MRYILLIMLVVLIVGCTPKPVPVVDDTTPQPQDNTPPKPVSLADIYTYGTLKTYDYRINTENLGERTSVDTSYTVIAATQDYRPVWFIEGKTETGEGVITTRMWVQKETNLCLVTEQFMTIGEQNLIQESKCPETGPYSTASSELTLNGEEETEVPAGKFMTKRYDYQGYSYWVADIGVPVKVAAADGSMRMVLTSYSR